MSTTRKPAVATRTPAQAPPPRFRGFARVVIAALCGLVGFLLVAQIQTAEQLHDRLAGEREEDLARILADLSSDSDRLAEEIAQLQLTLHALADEQEGERIALQSLQERLDDLRILTGVVETEGEGLTFTVNDPQRQVTQDQLVDAVQELRDAGAEAIAINDVRLVVSSAFVTREGALVLDGHPLGSPYRIAAIGRGETMARALEIPGGAIDVMTALTGVTADIEVRGEMTLPARSQLPAFTYAVPVPPEQGEPEG